MSFCDDRSDVISMFILDGDYPKACQLIESESKQKKSDNDYRVYYIAKYMNADFKNALYFFELIKNKTWQDYFFAGLNYESLGLKDKAQQCYLDSIASKDNTLSFYRLGKLQYETGDYRSALKYFNELIDYDSSYRLAYIYLGKISFKLKEYEAAYRYFSKALNFYPSNGELVELMAQTKDILGERFFEKKKSDIRQARNDMRLPAYKHSPSSTVVRVGLAVGVDSISFKCGGVFYVKDSDKTFRGDETLTYKFKPSGGKILLVDYHSGKEYSSFNKDLEVYVTGHKKGGLEYKYPFYIFDVIYGKGEFWHNTIDRAYRGGLKVLLLNGKLTLVNSIGMEEYLMGVLSAEIPADSGLQAIKAQAVAARSIAVKFINRHDREGFDFCADVHCQVYKGLSAETGKTTQAVLATKGEVLSTSDGVVEAFYHSNSGGCVDKEVWGVRDYLDTKFDFTCGSDKNTGPSEMTLQDRILWFLGFVPERCGYKNTSNFRWQRAYDAQDYAIVFGEDIRTLSDLKISDETGCFRIRKMTYLSNGNKYELTDGLKIRQHFDSLKSNAFYLYLQDKGVLPILVFWGAGFGHGGGMSQEGAIGMADKGKDYREILKEYYPGAEIIDNY
ncbi:MAG: SpoIID/LytB domain-containing protein [Candidatus Omnitrophota bacterium]